MFTYRKDLSRRGWRRSGSARVVFGLLGLALIFVGVEAWAWEVEYGGDPDSEVYSVTEGDGEPVQVYGEDGLVFEGTSEEVAAWLRAARGSRNYTVPILLLVSGVLSLLAGVTPSPLELSTSPFPSRRISK